MYSQCTRPVARECRKKQLNECASELLELRLKLIQEEPLKSKEEVVLLLHEAADLLLMKM